MPPCKGICEHSSFPYKTTRKTTYKNGFIRCQSCDKSIQCDLIKCPCCNADFRRKPRATGSRKRLLENIGRY